MVRPCALCGPDTTGALYVADPERLEVAAPSYFGQQEYEPEGGFHKLFCSACGSALWSRSPTDPEVISVRLGAFDEDPGVRPSYHQYVAYAAPWEPIPDDGLERFPERRPS